MQKHDHVSTVPGEPKAPEVIDHPIRNEPGSGAQAEDINIPLVALMVSFFAVLLLITIFSLEAWFYNSDSAERAAKQVPQGGPGTPLGALLSSEHTELYPKDATWNDRPTSGKPHTVRTIPIDRAMDIVAKEYAAAQGQH